MFTTNQPILPIGKLVNLPIGQAITMKQQQQQTLKGMHSPSVFLDSSCTSTYHQIYKVILFKYFNSKTIFLPTLQSHYKELCKNFENQRDLPLLLSLNAHYFFLFYVPVSPSFPYSIHRYGCLLYNRSTCPPIHTQSTDTHIQCF